MSFNELNSVEHTIIQQLRGVNLNAEPGVVGAGEQAKFGGLFYKSLILQKKLQNSLIFVNLELMVAPL
jgi:hypothetical protein